MSPPNMFSRSMDGRDDFSGSLRSTQSNQNAAHFSGGNNGRGGGGGPSAQLEAALRLAETTTAGLSAVLDLDTVIILLRNQDERLLLYLSQPAILQELTETALMLSKHNDAALGEESQPDSNQQEERQIKHALVACEILCTESMAWSNLIRRSPRSVLSPFWRILEPSSHSSDTASVLNSSNIQESGGSNNKDVSIEQRRKRNVVLACWNRLLHCILSRYPQNIHLSFFALYDAPLAERIPRLNDRLPELMSESVLVSDGVVRLCNHFYNHTPDRFVQWLQSTSFFPTLLLSQCICRQRSLDLDAFFQSFLSAISGEQTDIPNDIASVLLDAFHQSLDTVSRSTVSDSSCAKCSSSDGATDASIVDRSIDTETNDSAKTLFDRSFRTLVYIQLLEMIGSSSSDKSALISKVSTCMSLRVSEIAHSLQCANLSLRSANNQSSSVVLTPNGSLPRLGQHRLQLTRLVVALLRLWDNDLIEAMCSNQIAEIFATLFFQHPSCSQLHHSVQQFVSLTLLSDQHQQESSNTILAQSTAAVFMDRIVQQQQHASPCVYMGHVTMITEHIVSYSARMDQRHAPLVVSQDWLSYLKTEHADRIARNEKALGVPPSALSASDLSSKTAMDRRQLQQHIFEYDDEEDDDDEEGGKEREEEEEEEEEANQEEMPSADEQLARFFCQQVISSLPEHFRVSLTAGHNFSMDNLSSSLHNLRLSAQFDGADAIFLDEDDDYDDFDVFQMKNHPRTSSATALQFVFGSDGVPVHVGVDGAPIPGIEIPILSNGVFEFSPNEEDPDDDDDVNFISDGGGSSAFDYSADSSSGFTATESSDLEDDDDEERPNFVMDADAIEWNPHDNRDVPSS